MVVECFENAFIKLNQDICDLPAPGHNYETVWVKKCKTEIWENHCKQKLPGTVSESNLNFNEYKFDMPSRAEKILAAKTRDMAPNDSKKIKDIEVIKSL